MRYNVTCEKITLQTILWCSLSTENKFWHLFLYSCDTITSIMSMFDIRFPVIFLGDCLSNDVSFFYFFGAEFHLWLNWNVSHEYRLFLFKRLFCMIQCSKQKFATSALVPVDLLWHIKCRQKFDLYSRWQDTTYLLKCYFSWTFYLCRLSEL